MAIENHISRLNGVYLTYILDKYDRASVTIAIENNQITLKEVYFSLLGDITSNFHEHEGLKNIKFKADDVFEIHPDLPEDNNDHWGQIYFEGIENYSFQDVESPLKEMLFEKGVVKQKSFFGDEIEVEKDVLIGGGKLYFDIFWKAFKNYVWKEEKI